MTGAERAAVEAYAMGWLVAELGSTVVEVLDVEEALVRVPYLPGGVHFRLSLELVDELPGAGQVAP